MAATRADGTFALALPAGPAAFRLLARGGGVASSWLGGIYDASESEDLGDLTLPRGQAITGRVVNSSGTAVAAAEVTVLPGGGARGPDPEVSAAPHSIRTGPDGAFRLDDAAAGANRIVVEAKGYGAAHLVNVRGGAMAKPITVGPGIALTGTVVRGDRKTPAVGALVRFEADGVATRGVPTAGDGGFKLVDLPPRAGRVIV